jgi:hypothetical protein
MISSSKTTTSLTCRWEALSEVQVNSSANGTSDKIIPNDLVETLEEETEDEAHDQDLDSTVTTVKATQSKSQQPRATPQLSNQRSIVIEETPTAARVDGITDYLAVSEVDADASSLFGPRSLTTGGTINDTPQKPPAIHPRVVIDRKRPSPAIREPESEDEEVRRSSKRARKATTSDNDTQDSRISNIMVDTTPAPATVKKGRKRKSAVTDLQSAVTEIESLVEKTPSRSQRSSQRSASAPSAELYTGETPRVATSNSSISDKSQAVKFLKKQGGCLVDSIKESFNVLW